MINYSIKAKNLLFFIFLDVISLTFLFFYFLRIEYRELGKPDDIRILIGAHYKALFIFIFSWLLIANSTKLYKISRQTGVVEIYKRLFFQIILFGILVFAVSGLKSENLYSNTITFYYLLTLYAVCAFIRFVVFMFLKWYRTLGKNLIPIVFIDTNPNTIILKEILERRKDYGYLIKKSYFNCLAFSADELEDYLIQEKIQKVFYSMEGKFPKETQKLVDTLCEKLHIPIDFIPSSINEEATYLRLDYYETFPVFNYKNFPLDKTYNQFIKRIFDILFSLFVMVFLFSWLFPIIMVLILIDSGRPWFFIQKRSGKNDKEFDCYKFRTMVVNRESNIKPTVKGDQRITKIGRFLRKTSIDELPQFFNVLKGEMSIVGPRPHMLLQNEYYSDIISKYNLRHYVKPGITGLAQVKGYRGEIHSDLDMKKRIAADIFYIKNWSFLLDLIIIFKTFFKTLQGDKNAI